MGGARVFVVYGVPMTRDHVDVVKQKLDEADRIFPREVGRKVDMGEQGFRTVYNAYGPDYGYCGVILGEPINEGRSVDVAEISCRRPTDEQWIEAQMKLDALDAELRKVDQCIRTFILWGNL